MTWATSVPILVFLSLSVLDLGPIYATDRRQTKPPLSAPPIRGGHNNLHIVFVLTDALQLLRLIAANKYVYNTYISNKDES